MFAAAQHGCLPCVEYYVTVGGVDPWMKCEEGHNGVYYANKGDSEGKHAVKKFLMEHRWSKWEDMSESSDEEEECPLWETHLPSQRRRGRENGMYYLFQAAYEGCYSCVRRYIDEEGVDINSMSANRKYTALAWAEWALVEEVAGAGKVVDFSKGHPNLHAPNSEWGSTSASSRRR